MQIFHGMDLATLVRDFPYAVAVTDGTGRIVGWNRAATQLLGYTADQLVGEHLSTLVPQEDQEDAIALRIRIFRRETVQDHCAVRLHQDGRPIPIYVSMSAVRDAGDEVCNLIYVMRDRSSRIREDHALKIHRTLREVLPVVIVEEEKITEVWGEADRYAAVGLDTEVFSRWDGQATATMNGEEHAVHVTPIPLASGCAYLVRDDSRHVEMKRQMEAAQQQGRSAARELETFAHAVSRELRAPLRIVAGYSEDLSRRLQAELSAEDGADLERIRVAAQRMGVLVDGIRSLSSVGRGELREATIDFSALVGEIVDGLQRGDPARRVTLDVAPAIIVRSDPDLFRLVVTGLLEASWASTRLARHTYLSAGIRESGGRTLYYIHDNGEGFEFDSEAVFAPYSVVKPSDPSGIGLAIVRRAIRRLGGDAWVESSPGDGATFWLRLA